MSRQTDLDDTGPAAAVGRFLRVLVMVLLVLVLAFIAGGGWYFSGLIHADGLEVKPYPEENNLVLDPGSKGTVRIEVGDPTEHEMLDAPSTYGIAWDGGYGQVSGPVVSTDGDVVVRRFSVLAGAPPETDTTANLETAAFPDDPRFALGLTATEVEVEAPLGTFPAWFVPGTTSPQDTWAVLVHGKGGDRAEMYRMGRSTVAAGLPTLDITYRNDEGLPKDPSGLYQFGRTEWRDLAAAIDYAAANGAERVVLGASSMGGGIVASYLRHRKAGDGPQVVGLVLDSPMLDFGETVRFGASQLDVPLLGHVPGVLTWSAQTLAAQRYDIDWDAVDYLSDTSWLTMPALVFHGTADTTVPISTSRQLASQHPDTVELVVTQGVEHVRSWNAGPETYDKAVQAFLDGL